MSRWQDVSGKKLYVGNLDSDTTTEDLEKLFYKHGAIQSVWVARNPPGFAFVTFEDERDAQDAVYYLDGMTFNKRHIRVEIAKGPRNANKIPADSRVRDRVKSSSYYYYDSKNGGSGRGLSVPSSHHNVIPTSYRRSPSYGKYERENDFFGMTYNASNEDHNNVNKNSGEMEKNSEKGRKHRHKHGKKKDRHHRRHHSSRQRSRSCSTSGNSISNKSYSYENCSTRTHSHSKRNPHRY